MPALPAINAGMSKRTAKTQYTIRGVPASVDRALRARARREGRSLNDLALEALRASIGESHDAAPYQDLDDLVATWEEDPEFDAAIREQDQVDETLWS
jgi:plasmid stability protein